MQNRAGMTWKEISLAPRHGLGIEHLPVSEIRAPLPPAFEGHEKVMVMRYNGKLPMAGIRVRDVFHILWIERQFGELYDHGD